MTMDKGTTVIEGGAVEIAMSYRKELMPDQGLCIQVYGAVEGEDTEILRFDCFDQDPHYHYGPVNQNIRLHLDKTTAGNPIGWTMDNIRNKLPTMIRRAGYEDLAAAVEANPVPKAKLDEAEAKARELARTQRRTVTHKRGDFMFEAGNIRFGLEYRHLANDRGLAIHVLSDVAGSEVEMLAFDCFEVGPHYHYGPRNQDVRLYWDTTTSGEPLKWTLEQFKSRKLGSMITRAGYPSIAAALDEELIQSVLPSVEQRAFALVGQNKK
jgi:hypothetical protein